MQIYRNGRPKLAANDKAKGTEQENRVVVQDCNAYFGYYQVDDKAHVITFITGHASYPNWEGLIRKNPFTLHGDTLKYVVPSPTTRGGLTGGVIWLRLK